MTKEEFIQKAKSVHGDKYDYSKVEYMGCKTKVCIICPEHGEFWQRPDVHLKEFGCGKCSGKHKYTTEEYIQKAKEVHGDKYDYSKTEYINARTKVCIICPEHGEFWQKPYHHIRGVGCPKCTRPNLNITTEEFIIEARKIHGDKYDYSKTVYNGMDKKICIICPEHGEFWQRAADHLNGRGCKKCSGFNKSTEDFIEQVKTIHGDKYDYSKVKYINARTKVCIVCPEHGEFWSTPNVLLNGHSCPKCSQPHTKSNKEEFIAKAREVHGNKYDYSKTEYINARTKVCIICPEHGEFWQTPNNHLRGAGCPTCARFKTRIYKFNLLQEFKDEYAFRAFLENNDSFILYNILMNIEPKYEPIKKDIEKVLLNSSESDPIQALEDKYKSDEEDEVETEVKTESMFSDIDWDDDDAVNNAIESVSKEEDKEISIEDIIKNREQEIEVINRIEHMLTPEVREYIIEKFNNDRWRMLMAEKDK